jgi:tetratricopeptide (TPR) repeat protein
VARLLVATGATEDAQLAFEYAKKARGLAARVGVVRETCAIAAYQAGDWNAALAEFRAARRLTGRVSYLPLMADCERALGRLDRALDLVNSPEAKSADQQTKIELKIVESGIRRDQGLPDAAVVALQIPELTEGRTRPALARLYYAYADALLNAGRAEEARDWFGRAAEADVDGDTDAADRCDELDDITFDDLGLDDLDADDEPADDEPADDEPGADEPGADEPGADEPGADDAPEDDSAAGPGDAPEDDSAAEPGDDAAAESGDDSAAESLDDAAAESGDDTAADTESDPR